MYTNNIARVAGALAIVTASQAHMIMNTPTPYGLSTLQTSPLNGEGYNFPCQSGSRANAFDADGASNPMTVGQDNDVKFTGTAVHGGGSCQLSVTYDYPPPADPSKWKVIHSYIGSCPAQAAGNLVQTTTDDEERPTGAQCTGDDQTECLKTLKFQIPEGMKNGNATLAWTWFNKIGNREMYMNCAPISISGGSDDDTYFNSLPEIFMANIPGQCTTKEGVISFPNPGAQVTDGEAVTPGANGACPSGSSSGSSSSVQSSSSAAATSYATSLTYSAVQAGVTSAAAANAETTTIIQSTSLVTMTGYVQSSATAAATPSVSSSSSSTNGTCDSGSVSCSTPGDIICIGASQFGLCNINYCAVPEALAAGTTCSSGVISKRDVARRGMRYHRHAASHLYKRDFERVV